MLRVFHRIAIKAVRNALDSQRRQCHPRPACCVLSGEYEDFWALQAENSESST